MSNKQHLWRRPTTLDFREKLIRCRGEKGLDEISDGITCGILGLKIGL